MFVLNKRDTQFYNFVESGNTSVLTEYKPYKVPVSSRPFRSLFQMYMSCRRVAVEIFSHR